MALHEFMRAHRDTLISMVARKLRDRWPGRDERELLGTLPDVFDEIVGALQRDAGLPTSSPLPEHSPAADRLGQQRRDRGFPISAVVYGVGAISDAIGELASRSGLSFHAREYQVFNQCVDTSVANAIDEYWREVVDDGDRMVTERVGMLAHELRNALSSAVMAFDLVRTGTVGIEGRTGAVLARSLSRMQRLVNQELLVVQLRAGAQPGRERVDVGALLLEVEASAVRERGISVAVEASPGLDVESDERLLYSAISNLVQNGIKFSRQGGTVIMRARVEGDGVVVEIEDECGGLPAGDSAQLFHAFVRRGADRRGAGLGLTITREAVAALGGHVGVRDLPGKGCVFHIWIPRARPDGRPAHED